MEKNGWKFIYYSLLFRLDFVFNAVHKKKRHAILPRVVDAWVNVDSHHAFQRHLMMLTGHVTALIEKSILELSIR